MTTCQIKDCWKDVAFEVTGRYGTRYVFCDQHGDDFIHPGWRALHKTRDVEALAK